MTSTDTYQLKWHSHSTHMNGSVAALLRSDRFTDVVLCTMDGSQIPAHKFILSSCSVYLSNLFEGQRAVTRMGGMLYVVLPSEISTKALKTLVEYMYKGETTVSNEVLDTVLKAGEVLKIRGLWSQANEASDNAQPGFDASNPVNPSNYLPIAQLNPKKPDAMEAMQLQTKFTLKKDDKLLKALHSPTVQTPGGPRPMFVGPPKLVFIKTSEGGAQATLRPGTPKAIGQATLRAAAPKGTLLISPTPRAESPKVVPIEPKPDDSGADRLPLRVLKPLSREVPLVERKYGKKRKQDVGDPVKQKDAPKNVEATKTIEKQTMQLTMNSKLERIPENIQIDLQDNSSHKLITIRDSCENPPKPNSDPEVQIKEEPDWDASSIEEEERSIAEMFHAEMSVKTEPTDEVDIEEESLIYSPLACELCAEVFTQPAAWVRHVEGHAGTDAGAKRRKRREGVDDNDESTALLRCDLCQKHFLNPAEWVRHIQNTHTEIEGVQNKTCTYCKKPCPSHASMLIHMRTHTGERPFICGLCNKGFNVRSNLMRHLRTLHDQIEDSEDEVEESPPGPSEVKRES